MKKHAGGRPSKFDDLTVKKLEEAFAIGSSVEEACFYADISRQTFYAWLRVNQKLSDRFEALKHKPILKARQEVVKGLDGNPEFSLKFLERKKKDEFSLRTEVTGSDGQDIKVNLSNFKSLNVDELLREASEDESK